MDRSGKGVNIMRAATRLVGLILLLVMILATGLFVYEMFWVFVSSFRG